MPTSVIEQALEFMDGTREFVPKLGVTGLLAKRLTESRIRQRPNQQFMGIESATAKEVRSRLCIELEGYYALLPLEALHFRDEKGLPRLVPFSLSSASFGMRVYTSFEGGLANICFEPTLPRCLESHYRKLMQPILERAAREAEEARERSGKPYRSLFSYEMKWRGVIPEGTKVKIERALPYFEPYPLRVALGIRKPEAIFIIAEVDNWAASEITTDPIVVGVKKDKLHVIDTFDMTPLEEYVKREYAP